MAQLNVNMDDLVVRCKHIARHLACSPHMEVWWTSSNGRWLFCGAQAIAEADNPGRAQGYCGLVRLSFRAMLRTWKKAKPEEIVKLIDRVRRCALARLKGHAAQGGKKLLTREQSDAWMRGWVKESAKQAEVGIAG